MNQINTFSDRRLEDYCTYCGGPNQTRDHVPSKILLEQPYPENLPLVPCCNKCNNGFSLDEEYFACLIECIIAGSTDSKNLRRERIKRILDRKPSLRAKLTLAMVQNEDGIAFSVERERVESVVKKLGVGHLKFENSDAPIDAKASINFTSRHLLSEGQKNEFFDPQESLLPEMGSRGLTRMFETNDRDRSHWIDVQEGIYSYSVIGDTVRILIWDYLACEITWD